jgi:hypothetical protein
MKGIYIYIYIQYDHFVPLKIIVSSVFVYSRTKHGINCYGSCQYGNDTTTDN